MMSFIHAVAVRNVIVKLPALNRGKCDCGRQLKWPMFLKLEKMRQFFVSAVKGVAVRELTPNTMPGAPVDS
jgi:hypothetical protein